MKTPRVQVLAILAFLFLASSSAWAQYHGGFQGVVTDPSGAVIPDATVTATNKETGFSQKAMTTGSGAYTIGALAGGPYTVSVEKTGFSKKVLESVRLQSETVQSLNLSMDVGQSAITVTVTGDIAPVINTESGEIAGNITSKDVEHLPSIGRDPYQLMRLAPGVFGDGAISSDGSAAQIPGTDLAPALAFFQWKTASKSPPTARARMATTFRLMVYPSIARYGAVRRLSLPVKRLSKK